MKKGFTLVEIIISVAIIAIIGVSTTFVITKSTSNNELENATKQILEAANLYVKTEKDDNGNEYATQVLSGAKGVQIPLSNLVNKGYIDETMAETIYENKGNPSSDQDYYVMFLQGDGEEEKNYCDDGLTVTIASWTMETGKDIYLCNDYKEEKGIEVFSRIALDNVGSVNLTLPTITNRIEWFNGYDSVTGFFEVSDNTYYFVGQVDNNYIKFENDSTIFRIVSYFEEDGKNYLKLTLNETIENSNGITCGSGGPGWLGRYLQKCTNRYNIKSQKWVFSTEGDETVINFFTSDSVHSGSSSCCYVDDFSGGYTVNSWNAQKISEDRDSFLYLGIFEPLETWFNNLDNITQNKILEYNWSIGNSYYINSKFATLYYEDYIYASSGFTPTSSIYAYPRLTGGYFYNNALTTNTRGTYNEVIFNGLSTGLTLAYTNDQDGSSAYDDKVLLRPTIIIDGNSLISGGNGTETNPYIIS